MPIAKRNTKLRRDKLEGRHWSFKNKDNKKCILEQKEAQK